MSFSSGQTQMVFGGSSAQQRASVDGNSQAMAEVVTATTRRKLHGPKRGGHLSVHAIVDAVSTPTSATGLTLWYSNMPNPSLASDSDWVQDSDAGTLLALSGTGSAFLNVGNVFALHYMLKADVTAGSATIRVFARAEATES